MVHALHHNSPSVNIPKDWWPAISQGIYEAAVCKINRTYDIPYTAGYPVEGVEVFVDRHLPEIPEAWLRTLCVHERVEKNLLDMGIDYKQAHPVADKVEHAVAAVRNIDIDQYDLFFRKECKEIGSERITHVPDTLDMRPYEDEHDKAKLKAMMQGMDSKLLTKKKKKWVGQFKPSCVMQGTPLIHNAVGAATYNRKLQRLVDRMTEETEKEIKAMFESDAAAAHFGQDENIASRARIVTNKLQKRFDRLFGYHSKAMAEAMTNEANRQSSASLHKSLKELSGGLSLKTTVMTGPLATVISASVAENVALIKSIPEQYLNAITGATLRSITTGNGLADLLPFIEKHKMITKRRAKLIAHDQTRKCFSSINKVRMKSVGINKFKWVHSGGSNEPRKFHKDKWPAGLNGGIFSLDDLPVIDQKTGQKGIPGDLCSCACTMTPVLEFSDGEPTDS